MKDPKAEQLIQQFFTQKRTEITNTTKTVTIMKYLGSDDCYHFKVLDRFDIEDEAERLDFMNYLKIKMLESGEMKSIPGQRAQFCFELFLKYFFELRLNIIRIKPETFFNKKISLRCFYRIGRISSMRSNMCN